MEPYELVILSCRSERRTETASYEFLKLRNAVRGVSTDRRHTLRAQ